MPAVWTAEDFNIIEDAALGRRAFQLPSGTKVEIGNTKPRDVSAQLQKVGTIVAGMVVVTRAGDVVSIDGGFTPAESGNVQVTKDALPVGFRPPTTMWADGRGAPFGISTNGHLYANPAVAAQRVDATITFVTTDPWPTALPGVASGQPLVVTP